jgi:hypothetical protein
MVEAASDRRIIDMQIHSVGIDLGKTTFHLVGLGAVGKVLVRKKFTRNQRSGALPPSSKTTGFKWWAARSATTRPTRVDPVKLMCRRQDGRSTQ